MSIAAVFESLVTRLLRFRYFKFGVVGAGGTLVNMAVLYLCQEFIFHGITDTKTRLYVSLAVAIFLATVHNFCWNLVWTWADRRGQESSGSAVPGNSPKAIAELFGRYAMASWLGAALQYGLTLWLAQFMHYLLANPSAIALASVCNFMANDRWTFKKK
jgi:dolichol-phosphate mannosyltransferase